MVWEHRSFTREFVQTDESYRLSLDHKRLDAELNEFGADGWELVSAVPLFEEGVVTGMTYFMKRSVSEACTRDR